MLWFSHKETEKAVFPTFLAQGASLYQVTHGIGVPLNILWEKLRLPVQREQGPLVLTIAKSRTQQTA